MQERDVIIVGAGLAGISLARQLLGQGRSVTLLEKSRGVGGRCATRRVEDARVDHGLPLLHGRSPAFLDVVAGAGGTLTLAPDWPFHVKGPGTPCQPQGHDSRSRRWAVVEGVSALPKHLARGLDLVLEARVASLALDGGQLKLTCESGDGYHARCVVLTCPVPQSLELLEPLAQSEGFEELRGLVALLRRMLMIPCLTVMTGYDRPSAEDWHLLLPGPKSIIHSLINDSSKRGAGARQTLVIQGSPAFSRRELESEPARWGDALLEAAAAELGDWVGQPSWRQEHRWRYARLQRGDELSHPVLLEWAGGSRLGLCGEAFNPAGGAEGAYLSGLELAGRISAESATPVQGDEQRNA
jgi:renalase